MFRLIALSLAFAANVANAQLGKLDAVEDLKSSVLTKDDWHKIDTPIVTLLDWKSATDQNRVAHCAEFLFALNRQGQLYEAYQLEEKDDYGKAGCILATLINERIPPPTTNPRNQKRLDAQLKRISFLTVSTKFSLVKGWLGLCQPYARSKYLPPELQALYSGNQLVTLNLNGVSVKFRGDGPLEVDGAFVPKTGSVASW